LAAGCGRHSATPAPTTTTKPTTTTAPTTTAPTTTVAEPTPDGSPNEFSDFKIAMDKSTDYLDPGLSDTAEGWGVMWNVYLPLIGYRHVSGPKGARLVPYLATTLPRISHNRRTYSLTLRDKLKYSNGKRVEASDFKHAVERDF